MVTTHRHRDHWQALAEVVEATGARVAGARRRRRRDPGGHRARCATATRSPVGDCALEVIHIVGPHAGLDRAAVPGPGRDRAPVHRRLACSRAAWATRAATRQNFTSLINDVEHKMFGRLPDDTWFYPGHGKDCTLGAERPALPEWRARGW